MKLKMILTLATLALFGAFTAGNANAQTAAPAAPAGTSAVNGSETGQVIVSWNAVPDAAFYRIGWVARPDYDATVAAGRDWLEAFHFLDAANTGQTQWTLTRLSPGVEYYFIVASNDNRNGVPQYGDWSNLLTLTPAPPVDYSRQYPNCDTVREHHPGGVKRGSPIYRTSLDPDGDGTACEPSSTPITPTPLPTATPTPLPTATPTPLPTATPTPLPTATPTPLPTATPTPLPTATPTPLPTATPTPLPTAISPPTASSDPGDWTYFGPECPSAYSNCASPASDFQFISLVSYDHTNESHYDDPSIRLDCIGGDAGFTFDGGGPWIGFGETTLSVRVGNDQRTWFNSERGSIKSVWFDSRDSEAIISVVADAERREQPLHIGASSKYATVVASFEVAGFELNHRRLDCVN